MNSRSLSVRLTIQFACISIIIIGIVAFVAYSSTKAGFTGFIDKENEAKVRNLALYLESYYDQYGNWNDIDEVFQQNPSMMEGMMGGNISSEMRGNPFHMLGLSGYRVILTDIKGNIIADTDSDNKNRLDRDEIENGVPVMDHKKQIVGILLLGPKDTSINNKFLTKIYQSLIVTGLLSLLLSIALGILLSRKIAEPIKSISEASKRIAEGNLDEQVKVESFSDELKVLGESFNDMASKLKKSEELKRKLIADIAHELKTPLAIIQSNLEAILDDVYPLTKDKIANINDKSKLLSRLIDDLKMLNLAEAGNLKIHMSDLEVKPLLGSVKDTFQIATEKKNNKIEIDCPQNIRVSADESRLFQVFSNLIANANEFTDNGEIIISAKQAKEDGFILLSVRDTGTGIAEEELPRIFDRFWRAEESRNRKYGGSGLGLAIVKEIVELHGGKIWATGNKNKGTSINFLLKTA